MKSGSIVLRFLPIAAVVILAGCGPQSVEYYAGNPKEAKQVLKDCQGLGVAMLKDAKCMNAAEGNARYVNSRQKAADKKELEAIEAWGKSPGKKP